jgi:hypothetical protein
MPDTDAITSDRIAEQFAADLPSICFAAWVGEKPDADLRRLPPRDAANIAEMLAELSERYQDLADGQEGGGERGRGSSKAPTLLDQVRAGGINTRIINRSPPTCLMA